MRALDEARDVCDRQRVPVLKAQRAQLRPERREGKGADLHGQHRPAEEAQASTFSKGTRTIEQPIDIRNPRTHSNASARCTITQDQW